MMKTRKKIILLWLAAAIIAVTGWLWAAIVLSEGFEGAGYDSGLQDDSGTGTGCTVDPDYTGITFTGGGAQCLRLVRATTGFQVHVRWTLPVTYPEKSYTIFMYDLISSGVTDGNSNVIARFTDSLGISQNLTLKNVSNKFYLFLNLQGWGTNITSSEIVVGTKYKVGLKLDFTGHGGANSGSVEMQLDDVSQGVSALAWSDICDIKTIYLGYVSAQSFADEMCFDLFKIDNATWPTYASAWTNMPAAFHGIIWSPKSR